MRYARARIARELHDIVAHCLSAVVVQAGAGDYAVAGDPSLSTTVFDEILGSVRQAEDEIGRLAAVLADAPADSVGSGGQPVERVATLVRRAQTAGLSITYRLTGDPDRLVAEVWEGVFRVIREAVTNALKHAPGDSSPVRAMWVSHRRRQCFAIPISSWGIGDQEGVMSTITTTRPAGTAGWRGALIGTGVVGLAQLGSMAESGGNEPLWIAVADAVIGVAVLLLLIPAWRHNIRAAITEAVLLVLAAVSALHGVFVAGIPAGVRVIAGLTVVLALFCAGAVAWLSRTIRTSAVTS